MTVPAVDWVAPPFAGHLFPILGLAQGVSVRGVARSRVLSTPSAAASVARAGLSLRSFLAERESDVHAIADTRVRIGARPDRLVRQLRQNLALLGDLASELEAEWRARRPDLVVADFTLPVAGWVAERLGVPWWTTLPSPCVLETRTGTPAYVGGWRPPRTVLGRARDAAGRAAVRTFKRGVARAFRSDFAALGGASVYRPDGSERVYSSERILALGARELELDRDDWPACLEFIGPVTASFGPPAPDPPPRTDRPRVLMSLGTHLGWAEGRAVERAADLARRLTDWDVHVTLGRSGLSAPGVARSAAGPVNLAVLEYVAYDRHLAGYDVAIVHGGTGVTYACLERGVPLLVWPHDYDQFDHAARLLHRGLAERFPRRGAAAARAVLAARERAVGTGNFARVLASYDPVAAVARRLAELSADGACDRSRASR